MASAANGIPALPVRGIKRITHTTVFSLRGFGARAHRAGRDPGRFVPYANHELGRRSIVFHPLLDRSKGVMVVCRCSSLLRIENDL
jgi:hypothetical protein